MAERDREGERMCLHLLLGQRGNRHRKPGSRLHNVQTGYSTRRRRSPFFKSEDFAAMTDASRALRQARALLSGGRWARPEASPASVSQSGGLDVLAPVSGLSHNSRPRPGRSTYPGLP